jgi:HK97 family phage major capsid protein
MAEPDISLQNVNEAVTKLREEVKKYGVDSAQFKEMEEKTQAVLDAQEEKNQELILKMEEDRKAAEEQKERVEELEKTILRLESIGAKSQEIQDTPEYKAIKNFAIYGDKKMDIEEKQLLRSDDNTAGGYMVTTEMDRQMVKKITEISPVRSIAKVQTVGKKTLEVVKRDTIPTAEYEGEAAQGDQSESTYGAESITAYRLTVQIPYTVDLLMDAEWNLETEINTDVAEAFAYKEGNKFTLGSGAKEPEGFMTSTALQTGARISTVSGGLAWTDLILLTGDLKVGYNPMFGFNRQTLAYIRTLETTAGYPVWQAGLAPNQPNTIGGDRYVVLQDMAALAANSYSVVYADFMKGYRIIDRTGMTIIRDDYTGARNAIVYLTFRKYNTGQIVLEEAFKYLKTKA